MLADYFTRLKKNNIHVTSKKIKALTLTEQKPLWP